MDTYTASTRFQCGGGVNIFGFLVRGIAVGVNGRFAGGVCADMDVDIDEELVRVSRVGAGIFAERVISRRESAREDREDQSIIAPHIVPAGFENGTYGFISLR